MWNHHDTGRPTPIELILRLSNTRHTRKSTVLGTMSVTMHRVSNIKPTNPSVESTKSSMDLWESSIESWNFSTIYVFSAVSGRGCMNLLGLSQAAVLLNANTSIQNFAINLPSRPIQNIIYENVFTILVICDNYNSRSNILLRLRLPFRLNLDPILWHDFQWRHSLFRNNSYLHQWAL